MYRPARQSRTSRRGPPEGHQVPSSSPAEVFGNQHGGGLRPGHQSVPTSEKKEKQKEECVSFATESHVAIATSLLLYTGGFVASLICFFDVVALKKKKKKKKKYFTVLCGIFGSPYLGKAQQLQEQRLYPVQYFRVSKQWHGCQGLGLLTCAQMLMHVIAHGSFGTQGTVTESALKVDSGRKIRCRTWDSNPRQYCARHSVGRSYRTIPCPCAPLSKRGLLERTLAGLKT